jgi:hypothetical protein
VGWNLIAEGCDDENCTYVTHDLAESLVLVFSRVSD